MYGGSVGAKNLILQPAPAGGWEAVTKVALPQGEEYEQAGLIVHAGDAQLRQARADRHPERGLADRVRPDDRRRAGVRRGARPLGRAAGERQRRPLAQAQQRRRVADRRVVDGRHDVDAARPRALDEHARRRRRSASPPTTATASRDVRLLRTRRGRRRAGLPGAGARRTAGYELLFDGTAGEPGRVEDGRSRRLRAAAGLLDPVASAASACCGTRTRSTPTASSSTGRWPAMTTRASSSASRTRAPTRSTRSTRATRSRSTRRTTRATRPARSTTSRPRTPRRATRRSSRPGSGTRTSSSSRATGSRCSSTARRSTTTSTRTRRG